MPVKQSFKPPKPIQGAKPKSSFKPPVQKKTAQDITLSSNQATTVAPAQKEATKQDQQVVSKQESLKILKTTLEASIGSICYLRRLLPDDHFTDTYMASSIPLPGKSIEAQYGLSQPDPNGSQQPGGGRGFKYPKISQEKSPEGMKLMRVLEEGVMDAVEKGYLRSLMFIIFLDKNDPTNIVESYTFNFFYSPSSGAPTMDITHKVNGEPQSAIEDRNEHAGDDLGLPRNHHDVRKNIKGLMKTLILGTQRLVDLPRQRYVDFKLSYNPNAPADYEVPGFKDCTGVPLFMCTDEVNAAPTAISIGSTATGAHGMSLTTLSIAEFLPPRLDSEVRQDEGEIDDIGKEREEQLDDAGKRKIAWSADLPLYDRKAYEPSCLDPFSLIIPELEAPTTSHHGHLKQPLGKWCEDGTIEAMVKPGATFNLPALLARGFTRKNEDGKASTSDVLITDLLELQSPRPHDATDFPRSQTVFDPDADGETDYGGSQWVGPHEKMAPSAQHAKQCPAQPIERTTSPAHSTSPDHSDEVEMTNASALPQVNENEPRPSEDPLPNPATVHKKRRPLKQKSGNTTHPSERPTKSTKTNEKSYAAESLAEPTKTKAKRKPKKATPSKATNPASLKKKRHARKPKDKDQAMVEPASDDTLVPASPEPTSDSTPNTKKSQQLSRLTRKCPDTLSGEQTSTMTATSSPAKKTKSKNVEPRTEKTPMSLGVDKIDCFCRCEDEADGSMQCDGCAKWLHCCCVGFSELKAASQVNSWCCLICKMEKDDGQKWTKKQIEQARDKMAELALFRRALLYVRHNAGIGNTISELRETYGCSPKALKKAFDRLYDEGFMDCPYGKRKKRNDFYHYIRTPETTERVTQYFTPGGGVEDQWFDYRKSLVAPEEPQENTQTNSQCVPLPEPSRGLTLSSSLAPPNTIKSPFGNFLPSLDGQPVSQYTLPLVRSSRAESPIELLEDW